MAFGLISRIKRRWKLLGLVFVAAALCVLTLYQWRSSSSPRALADKAVRALERGDARQLCALADPEELTRLHLTPANVTSMLKETLWRADLPSRVDMNKVERTRPDESVWKVQWTITDAGRNHTYVFLLQYPDGSYKLCLSETLRSTCGWSRGNPREGTVFYIELAQKNEILGLREQGGDYILLEKLAHLFLDRKTGKMP